MKLTSTAFHFRIKLLEYDDLIVFHLVEIVPLVLRTVGNECVLSDSVGRHNVLAHCLLVIIHSASVTERQRPVIARSLQRLPETRGN